MWANRYVAEANSEIAVDDGKFDIKTTYLKFLEEDSEMTMPIAAIEALAALLGTTETSTSSELMKVLAEATAKLKSSVENSISLSAGCDLFTRFVLRNINEYGVCLVRTGLLRLNTNGARNGKRASST